MPVICHKKTSTEHCEEQLQFLEIEGYLAQVPCDHCLSWGKECLVTMGLKCEICVCQGRPACNAIPCECVSGGSECRVLICALRGSNRTRLTRAQEGAQKGAREHSG